MAGRQSGSEIYIVHRLLKNSILRVTAVVPFREQEGARELLFPTGGRKLDQMIIVSLPT